MWRLVSAIVAVVLAAVVAALGGYWNSRGVVPLGDARIPAQAVGALIVVFAGVIGLSFGHLVPWPSIIGRVRDLSDGQSKPKPAALQDTKGDLNRVAEIPVRVAHLLGCVHHLRVALGDDADGQELLDKIAVKVGRVSAELNRVQSGGV